MHAIFFLRSGQNNPWYGKLWLQYPILNWNFEVFWNFFRWPKEILPPKFNVRCCWSLEKQKKIYTRKNESKKEKRERRSVLLQHFQTEIYGLIRSCAHAYWFCFWPKPGTCWECLVRVHLIYDDEKTVFIYYSKGYSRVEFWFEFLACPCSLFCLPKIFSPHGCDIASLHTTRRVYAADIVNFGWYAQIKAKTVVAGFFFYIV